MDIKERYGTYLNDRRLVSSHFNIYLRKSRSSSKSLIVSMFPPSFDIYRNQILDISRVYVSEDKDVNFFDKISHELYRTYVFTELISLVNSTIVDPLLETKDYSVFGLVDTNKLTILVSRALNFILPKPDYALEALSTEYIHRWLIGNSLVIKKPKHRVNLYDLDIESIMHRSEEVIHHNIQTILKQSL